MGSVRLSVVTVALIGLVGISTSAVSGLAYAGGDGRPAGETESAVSGYAISELRYVLALDDPSLIAAVTFRVPVAAGAHASNASCQIRR